MYVRIYFNSAYVINLGTKGTTPPPHVFLFYKKEKNMSRVMENNFIYCSPRRKKLYLNLTWFDLQDI